MDTQNFEELPLWLRKGPSDLMISLRKYNISLDMPIVLVGDSVMASTRVASVLVSIGGHDVRVLDGGIDGM